MFGKIKDKLITIKLNFSQTLSKQKTFNILWYFKAYKTPHMES